MKVLYAIPTKLCNQSCPHCNIKDTVDNYNEEAFLRQLRGFDGHVTLFGGEPTLFPDRLMKALATEKVESITTNLMTLNDELIAEYKDLYVATSWNDDRFVSNQYNTWLANLKRLEANDITCLVLITLTDGLIKSNINEFMRMIRLWAREYKAIDSILFEHLITDNKDQEFYERVDDWLCRIYRMWDVEIQNQIVDKLNNWQHDCTGIATLYPDGRVALGCPHQSQMYVPSSCLTCSEVSKCRPCRLQQHCTYPKKLAKLVKSNV